MFALNLTPINFWKFLMTDETDDENKEKGKSSVVDFTKISRKKNRLPSRKGHKPPNLVEAKERQVLVERQEQYCILRAEGFPIARAYGAAYPDDKTPGQNGWHLEQKEHIQERIRALSQERAYAAGLVNPQESLIRWNEIYLDARSRGDTKMMVIALQNIDEITGVKDTLVKRTKDTKAMFTEDGDDEATQRMLSIIKKASKKED